MCTDANGATGPIAPVEGLKTQLEVVTAMDAEGDPQ